MELFSISCPTCQSRLKVRNLSAIGQILSCPKCASMVQVTPPAGWKPPAKEAPAPAPVAAANPTPVGIPVAASTPPPGAAAPRGFVRPFGFERAAKPAWQKPQVVAPVAGGLLLLVVVIVSSLSTAPPAAVVAEAENPPVAAPPNEPAAKTDPQPETPAKKADAETAPPKAVDPPADPAKVEPLKAPNPPADPAKTDPPKTETPAVVPPEKAPEKPIVVPLDKPAPEKGPEQPPVDKPLPDPDKPAVRPQPVRNVLTRGEVDQRLATKVESIRAANVPLVDAVDTLAQLSALQITLDLEAFGQAGILADEAVTIDMQKVAVAEVLDRLLEDRGLVYVVESGQIRVTTRARQRDAVREESYDTADLCVSPAAGEQLAKLVAQVIEPGAWPAPPTFERGALKIKHNDWVQRRVTELLKRLRTARGTSALPPDAADRALASRTSRAAEKLLKPLTANFTDLPLSKIVATLQSRTDFKLLFDSLALAEQGHSPESKGSVQTREAQPLAAVLTNLLQPLDLTCRVVDENTLQITSRQAAAEQIELEAYRARELAPTPEKAAELLARIRAEVLPGSWDGAEKGAGGKPAPKAADPKAADAKAEGKRTQRGTMRPGLGFDELSGCIFVAHHQMAQVHVEDLLDTLRRPVEQAPPPAAEPKK